MCFFLALYKPLKLHTFTFKFLSFKVHWPDHLLTSELSSGPREVTSLFINWPTLFGARSKPLLVPVEPFLLAEMLAEAEHEHAQVVDPFYYANTCRTRISHLSPRPKKQQL